MKYVTKQQRLLASIDAYQKKSGKRAVTMEEVAYWAIASGLYPIPRRGDPPKVCLDWEGLLEAAISQSRIPNS